jgi:hypothetical protein
METELAPLLIIGNNFFDKEGLDSKFVYETFEIQELIEIGIKVKYCPINILKEDEKLMDAMRWLIRNII